MKRNCKWLCALAFLSAMTFAGCATVPTGGDATDGGITEGEEAVLPDAPLNPPEELPDNVQPQINHVTYIKMASDGVNIRSGAGTGYKSLGYAEKNTLYSLEGTVGNWYKTKYKGMEAYIYKDYCLLVEFEKADDEVEQVIDYGTRFMGVKYVYGATRYHNGNGVLLSGFTESAFDCSSLMQYIFKKGANVNLQVTTRTQVLQGKTVTGSLRRGDLMFFTNSSRKNKIGVERIGHVALYLGNNYILHTASDYAKIEQISSARWGYYIQSQRFF